MGALMRATPRLGGSVRFDRRPAVPAFIRAVRGSAVSVGALLALAGCHTVTTVAGRVDSPPGRVSGNFYYLPKGLFRIRGGYADKEYAITVSVSYVADPRRRFYLEPRHNIFYDDEYKLQINAKGLLETVQVTAEDRTADIAGDLAQVAAGSLKFAAGSGVASFDLRDLAAKTLEPFDYTFAIDEAPEVRSRLHARTNLKIVAHNSGGARHSEFPFHDPGRELVSSGKSMPAAARERDRMEAAGVVFRPARAFTVRITDLPFRRRLAAEMERQAAAAQNAAARTRQLNATPETQAHIEELERRAGQFEAAAAQKESATESLRIQTTVLLPDENAQLLFAFGRTPFIRRTDNLAFNEGMLTKIDGARPSPVVGFLQIPKKILGAIVPLPLELKNTQITNIKAARTLESLRHPESEDSPR
jgi:hypothetical protein